MAGIIGGNLAIAPIIETGDSVIRVKQFFSASVNFPEAEELTQTITDSVTVNVT